MTTDTDKLMNPVAQRFKEFCGQEQYEKFVKKLADSQRVAYWQAQLWERFLRVAGLAINSDYESIIPIFRLQDVHIPINANESLADRQTPSETFIRSIRTTFACNHQPPPRRPQADTSAHGACSSSSAGITQTVTLGSHHHFVDITATFDWSSEPSKAIVQDSSNPLLLLGCSDQQAKVIEFSDFMQSASEVLGSEIITDPRLAQYLFGLRIRVQSFTTGTLYAKTRRIQHIVRLRFALLRGYPTANTL